MRNINGGSNQSKSMKSFVVFSPLKLNLVSKRLQNEMKLLDTAIGSKRWAHQARGQIYGLTLVLRTANTLLCGVV